MSEGVDISYVVDKIETLYASTDPAQIRDIQKELQLLQKSESGFLIAKQLFNYPSKNCRFFGALTLAVVIHEKEWTTEQLSVLANETLNITASLLMEGFDSNGFIIRKMLSNLSEFFIRDPQNFNPIDALFKRLGAEGDLRNYIHTLDVNNLTLLLLFHTILIEDTTKAESTAVIHRRMMDTNFQDVLLIFNYLTPNFEKIPDLVYLQSLDYLNAWVVYVGTAESKSDVRYRDEHVDPLIDFLFAKFKNFDFINVNGSQMGFLGKVMPIVTDILEVNSGLLSVKYKEDLRSLLFKSFGTQFINAIILPEERREEYAEEIDHFANLIIAFLTMDILKFSRRILEPETQEIIDVLIKFSDYPGAAIIDESVSDHFLTLWEELASNYSDNDEYYDKLFEDNKDQFKVTRNSILSKVGEVYWKKVQLPKLQELESNKNEFQHFRSRVADFFMALYPLLGNSLYEGLSSKIVNNTQEVMISHKEIFELESSLYLLFKITDDLTFYDENSSLQLDKFIVRLFEYNLIGTIQNFPNDGVYMYVYATLINFLSSIQDFFSRYNELIAPTFDFLFSVILGKKGEQYSITLSLVASRTVLKICQNSRKGLTKFLPDLGVLVVEMIRNSKIDNLIRQRMCHSFASISQSLKDPFKIAENILLIINELSTCAATAMKLDFNDEVEEYLVSLSSCVLEIGKACRLPEEVDDFYNEQEKEMTNACWNEDPLHCKSTILSIIRELSLGYSPLARNSSVTEKCCLIFKSGINEPIDGPFNFSLETIFEYLKVKASQDDLSSYCHVYSLIETIVITRSRDLNTEFFNELLEQIVIRKLELIKSDPDPVQGVYELYATILARKPSLVLTRPSFRSSVLIFAVEGLTSHETLVIKSASKFWVNLISLRKGTMVDQKFAEETFTNGGLGGILTVTLLRSFVNCSRSQLEYYYPMFRNLITKYPLQVKGWLKFAFTEAQYKTFSDEHVIDLTINKIMLTRGLRIVSATLKDIWLSSNGYIDFDRKQY